MRERRRGSKKGRMGNVIQPVGLATIPRCAPLDTDRRKFFMMITVTFPLNIRVLMCI